MALFFLPITMQLICRVPFDSIPIYSLKLNLLIIPVARPIFRMPSHFILDGVLVVLQRDGDALCASSSDFQQLRGLLLATTMRPKLYPLSNDLRSLHRKGNQNLLCVSVRSNQNLAEAYIVSFLAKTQNSRRLDPTSRTNF
mmetsp:Transcript_4126/g.9331  ORF Transcript_4126/g.9331 Transcript_4126/m.9331 type:complete len:141 (+) Transcript_4126:94-516(+)